MCRGAPRPHCSAPPRDTHRPPSRESHRDMDKQVEGERGLRMDAGKVVSVVGKNAKEK